MQAQQPPREDTDHGPLNTPRIFRRVTGAHEIIVSLVLTDLANGVLCVLVGAILLPLSAQILQRLYALAHVSLALDLVLLVSLAALGIGIIAERFSLTDAEPGAGFGCAAVVIIASWLVLGILKLLSAGVLSIPVHLPPLSHTLATNPWLSPLPALGAIIAAGLVLLAHFLVIRRYRVYLIGQQHTYMRAHQDGDAWGVLEAAYRHLRQTLARFDPPPIPELKTPATFCYYRASPDITDPERKIHWVGQDLVIALDLLSVEQEIAEVLLPYLARQLYDYHYPEIRTVTMLLQCAREARTSPFTRRLLFLPRRVAKTCEERWSSLDKERVLDRDRFAWLLGEGRHLRKQLQHQLKLKEQRGEEDNAIPSLTERIDHMLALGRREQRQVKRLLAQLPSSTKAANTSAPPPGPTSPGPEP